MLMVCAGATLLGGPAMGVMPSRVSMGSAYVRPPSSFHRPVALVHALFLVALPKAGAVTCDTCKDTINGCTGGAACPLLKAPQDNAAALQSISSSLVPDMSRLLPPGLLCTFTRSVMETLSAVAKAPKGGGKVDLSSGSIASSTGVVRAAINGFCTWEEAGLELATRLEAGTLGV